MPRKSSHISIADENAAPGGVAAVDRAISLLAVFRQADRALTITELAQRTRLHKSTVLRLVTSLAHGQFLQRTAEGQWALGPEVSRLAAIYWASFQLEDVVLPEMHKLVQKTQESVSFHVRQADKRLVLFRVDSPQLLRDHTRRGDLVPLDQGAGGRVLMAFSGAPGPLYDQIRRDGYALIHGDRVQGVSGVSAPVFNARGELVGALTLSGPEQRIKAEFITEVRQSALRLSQALGA